MQLHSVVFAWGTVHARAAAAALQCMCIQQLYCNCTSGFVDEGAWHYMQPSAWLICLQILQGNASTWHNS